MSAGWCLGFPPQPPHYRGADLIVTSGGAPLCPDCWRRLNDTTSDSGSEVDR